MASSDWIMLHRKIQKHWLWKEPRIFSNAEAWIDLLLEARYSSRKTKVLVNGRLFECGRGQVVRSQVGWGERWLWAASTVKRFFLRLKTDGMIDVHSDANMTTITICNYDTYQLGRRGDDEAKGEVNGEVTTRWRRGDDEVNGRNKDRKKERREEGKNKALTHSREPSEHSRLVQSLADVFYDGKVIEGKGPVLGKVAKQIAQLGGKPEDVPGRYAALVNSWNGARSKATVHQLVDKWASLNGTSDEPYIIAPGGQIINTNLPTAEQIESVFAQLGEGDD